MIQCEAHTDLSGGNWRWYSMSGEPWLELRPSCPIAGRWLRLTWRAGLLDRVCRPVIRCELPDRNHDILLAGAPFGRGEWVGHIPKATRRVFLSPFDGPGSFSFAIETAAVLSLLQVLAITALRSPGRMLHGLGAGLIGRRADMNDILRRRLSAQPLSAYGNWQKRRSRAYQPDFDGPLPAAATGRHLRLLIEANETLDAQQLLQDLHLLEGDLAANVHASWSVGVLAGAALRPGLAGHRLPGRFQIADSASDVAQLTGDLAADDLVAAIPAGTRLHPSAIDMIVAAAARSPDVSLFFGNDDRLDSVGRPVDPVIRPGFDPLWSSIEDTIGASAIWRVGSAQRHKTRDRLLPSPAVLDQAVSLSRFLFRFPSDFPVRSPAVVRRATNASSDWVDSDAPAPDSDPHVNADKLAATVSILIPTRDRLDLLKPCVDSIMQKTAGNYQILILDNGSERPETKTYLASLEVEPRVHVVSVPGPFNFSRICNAGVALTAADVLVFLNNDTTIIDADWLERLTAVAMWPDVGAVGVKLLYPDKTVQHAGVVAGLFGGAGHFEIGMDAKNPGFFGWACSPHRTIAVTGACLAVERSKFIDVGGFDEINLPVDLNDIDLCLRLYRRGWHALMLGDCCLTHHESASRGKSADTDRLYAREKIYFSKTWLFFIRSDPYFSPILSLYASTAQLG